MTYASTFRLTCWNNGKTAMSTCHSSLLVQLLDIATDELQSLHVEPFLKAKRLHWLCVQRVVCSAFCRRWVSAAHNFEFFSRQPLILYLILKGKCSL